MAPWPLGRQESAHRPTSQRNVLWIRNIHIFAMSSTILFGNLCLYARSKCLTNSIKRTTASWSLRPVRRGEKQILRLLSDYQKTGLMVPNPKGSAMTWRLNSGVSSSRIDFSLDKRINNKEGQLSETKYTNSPKYNDRNIPVPANGMSNIPVPTNGKRRMAKTKKEISVGKDVIISLQVTFGMSLCEALNTVKSKKFFYSIDAEILKTISVLRESSITGAVLMKAPLILLQPADEVRKKLTYLTSPYLFLNVRDGFGFCCLREEEIMQYRLIFKKERAHFPHHNNRIYYMADQLMVPVGDLTAVIASRAQNRLVLSMEFYKLEAYMKLLNAYDVPRESILQCLYSFRRDVRLVEDRLKAITDAGCQKPKLWMLYSDDIFDSTLNKYQSRNDIDGCTLKEYLMTRLQCKEEDLEEHFRMNESLRKVSIRKAQPVLDRLFSEGFTADAALKSLPLLMLPQTRISQRIQRLKETFKEGD